MKFCGQCEASVEEDSRFCPECGVPMGEGSPKFSPQESFMGRVERAVYFKIARGYAWSILFLSSVSLVVSIVSFAPAARDLWIGGDTKVSSDDIRHATGSEKPGRASDETREKIDPVRMAKLEQTIYEIIELLPREQQRQTMFGVTTVKLAVEDLRRLIRNLVDHRGPIEDRIAVLQELKNILTDFPEIQRLNVVNKYFDVKTAKERSVEAKKAEARQGLWGGSMLIMSSITIITFGSLILVLLAVERNTRRA